MRWVPGFRGIHLLVMLVELSNWARLKSEALPVGGFLVCVRALPAAAESITKQEIKITVRQSLRISDPSFLCFRVRVALVLRGAERETPYSRNTPRKGRS